MEDYYCSLICGGLRRHGQRLSMKPALVLITCVQLTGNRNFVRLHYVLLFTSCFVVELQQDCSWTA